MRKVLLAILITFVFSNYPCFAEEKEEVNWKLKAYQNELRALRAEVELGFARLVLNRLKEGSVESQIRERILWLEEKIKELEEEQKGEVK